MTGHQPGRDALEKAGDTPVRHSRRFSNELVEDARKVFQEETGRALTAEDARQMLENLTGFFMVLHEWDRAQTKRDSDSASRKNGSNS